MITALQILDITTNKSSRPAGFIIYYLPMQLLKQQFATYKVYRHSLQRTSPTTSSYAITTR